jgi:hypothetical protein
VFNTEITSALLLPKGLTDKPTSLLALLLNKAIKIHIEKNPANVDNQWWSLKN